MLADLPTSVQEHIYKKLNVKDRLMFKLAFPKCGIKFSCKYKEKKLGVLYGAVSKKKVTGVTKHIQRFLQACNGDDPTLKEMADVIHDISLIDHDVVKKSIIDKIHDGTICEDDFPELSDEVKNDFHTRYHLDRCTVPVFNIVLKCEAVAEYIQRIPGYFYYRLYCIGNASLIEHIETDSAVYNLDLVQLKDYVKTNIANVLYTYVDIWKSSVSRQLLMKYIGYTKDELEKLWVECINHMLIDVAIGMGEILKTM